MPFYLIARVNLASSLTIGISSLHQFRRQKSSSSFCLASRLLFFSQPFRTRHNRGGDRMIFDVFDGACPNFTMVSSQMFRFRGEGGKKENQS